MNTSQRGSKWADEKIQFARVLCAISEVFPDMGDSIAELCKESRLSAADITELLEKAHHVWNDGESVPDKSPADSDVDSTDMWSYKDAMEEAAAAEGYSDESKLELLYMYVAGCASGGEVPSAVRFKEFLKEMQEADL